MEARYLSFYAFIIGPKESITRIFIVTPKARFVFVFVFGRVEQRSHKRTSLDGTKEKPTNDTEVTAEQSGSHLGRVRPESAYTARRTFGSG